MSVLRVDCVGSGGVWDALPLRDRPAGVRTSIAIAWSMWLEMSRIARLQRYLALLSMSILGHIRTIASATQRYHSSYPSYSPARVFLTRVAVVAVVAAPFVPVSRLSAPICALIAFLPPPCIFTLVLSRFLAGCPLSTTPPVRYRSRRPFGSATSPSSWSGHSSSSSPLVSVPASPSFWPLPRPSSRVRIRVPRRLHRPVRRLILPHPSSFHIRCARGRHTTPVAVGSAARSPSLGVLPSCRPRLSSSSSPLPVPGSLFPAACRFRRRSSSLSPLIVSSHRPVPLSVPFHTCFRPVVRLSHPVNPRMSVRKSMLDSVPKSRTILSRESYVTPCWNILYVFDLKHMNCRTSVFFIILQCIGPKHGLNKA
ncbi:hypothetical protein FKP32DRAFT_303156 [Trametes sanguinea]|nr:hypothetical protein FKP32DRAFT_303156 [Trametes sanguinea]